MNNSSQRKIGAVLSYVSLILGVVIGLAYTPVMIRLLGQNEYGLYSTATSTVSMLSLLSLGLKSSYVRYFAQYKKSGDLKSVYKLNGLFLLIFSIIGIVSLVCGFGLINHLNVVFKTGLNLADYETVKVLMLVLVFNMAFSFPLSVFSSIVSANERFVFQKILDLVIVILNPLVILPLLLIGYKSIALVSVAFVLQIVVGFVNVYYVLFKLKNRFIFCGFESGILKALFAYTFFIAINMIIDQINWNVDKVLLARYKGAASVAVYSLGYALYSYYMACSVSISNVFTPKIHRIVAETTDNPVEQKRALSSLFVSVGRIQFFVLGLILTGFVFFGKNFIADFWVGVEYSESYYVALLLIFSATIPLIQNVGIEIQRAQNKHHFRSYAYLVMAIFNVAISIYLCQLYGAIGSAVGTAISLILANGLVMNVYYHKKCNVDVAMFWKNIIVQCRGLFLPLIVGFLMYKYMNLNLLVNLICGIFLYSVVYVVSMWHGAMNDFEKDIIRKFIRKFI